MSRRIAILGASGSVGNALAVHILRGQLLEPRDKLLLVGHGVVKTERKLLSTCIDLLDAFDDGRVAIEMVPDVRDVEADFVIVAAGTSISPSHPTRRDLGAANRVIFEHIADECASRLPEALFLVVSNPVELAVQILSFATDRKRVFGMGAQQDSLRFARAIAADLSISRHDVGATVLGEHGQAMIPVWSSAEVLVKSNRKREELARLGARCAEIPLQKRVAELRTAVSDLLSQEQVGEAYALARQALPDARIFVEPFITAYTMHSTPNATANATLQCLAAALANDHRGINGQVILKGEFLGIQGVCGVPLTVGINGWRTESLDGLEANEIASLATCSESINGFVAAILTEAVREAVPLEDAVTG